MTILYLGLDQGVVRVRLNGDATAEWAARQGPVGSVAVDLLAPRLVYAATLGHGLLRSGDGGASWVAAGAGIGSSQAWVVGAIFRSRDRGESWAEIGCAWTAGASDLKVRAAAVSEA